MRGWAFPWLVYQPGHAAPVGPDPESALPVFGDVIDDHMSQTFTLAVVCEAIAVKAREPLLRAEPNVAFAILVNGLDVAVCETVRDIVVARRKPLGGYRQSSK